MLGGFEGKAVFMTAETRKHGSASFKPGSWLTFLLMTSALTWVAGKAMSQTAFWDFPTGAVVVFSPVSGTAEIVVDITGNVEPGSITFAPDSGNQTHYTIVSDPADPTFEILSDEGDLGGTNSGLMLIDVGDSATISAGMSGNFQIERHNSANSNPLVLTLGGISGNADTTITVVENVGLTIAATAGIAGLIYMEDGDLVIDGTVGSVDTDSGVTTTVNGTVGEFDNGFGAITTINGTVGEFENDFGATVTINGTGIVTGTFDNSGIASIAGDVGSLVNTGNTTILDGAIVTANTDVQGGLVTVEAGAELQGDVGIDQSARLVVGGTVVGTVTNSGRVGLDGTVTGDLTNNDTGILRMDGDISGALTNAGSVTVTGGSTVSVGGLFDNSGAVNVNGSVTLTTGGIINQDDATFVMRDGSTTTGGFTNAGSLEVVGAVAIEGLNSTGSIDLEDNGVNEVLTLTGTTVLGGDIFMDIDLSEGSSLSDLITVSSAASGDVVLHFNNVGAGNGLLETGVGILVVDFEQDNGTVTATATGLAGEGDIWYYLDTRPQDIRVHSFTNPNVTAMAGSVTLTQSLIGSVINRPSSPFVTGLAVKDDDPCHPGVWARVIGGRADVSGQTQTVDTNIIDRSYDSRIKASYSGIQLGGDISCFDEPLAGWDMSFGGILGVNSGATSQPIFDIDQETQEQLPDVILSNNFTDFQQGYVGAYVSAVKGPLLLDLQFRLEKTQFDLTNDGTGNERLGILDQKFDSSGRTFSGSLSYVIPLSEDKSFNLVPTVGFAITKYKTDPILYTNNRRLEVDDASTEVGFIGAALSKTKILPSGKAALTYFATGTYYKDFADATRSVYYVDESADDSYSSNLGEYGEASIGVNYTQILEEGNAILNAKQLNAAIRLDGRFGETLDSWGVTAQMRLQF
jgi:fibronectin-binding autotransporter adhesin